MSLVLTLIAHVTLGFTVGALGAVFQWGFPRTLLTATVLSLALSFTVGFAHAETLSPGIVALRATSLHIAIGSASIVEGASHKKYILTNWHVCKSARWKGDLIASYEAGTVVRGKIIKTSPVKDLCAAIAPLDAPALKLAPNSVIGDPVLTRGYPQGIPSESQGIIGGLTHWDYVVPIAEVGECVTGSRKVYHPYDSRLYGCRLLFTSQLTTLYSRPGSSGSPVVNTSGELVGVISSFHPESAYEGGMVTFEDVKAFLSDL